MVAHTKWTEVKRHRRRFPSKAILISALFVIFVSASCTLNARNIGAEPSWTALDLQTQLSQYASERILSKDDYIYRPGPWDGAPVVVQKYKLLFFTVAKVGCTVWKQLFRRMAGYDNWKAWNMKSHDPNINGLRYLYDYSLQDANNMMTSKEWTKAIFVRDPKARIVSAYLDKGRRKDGMYVSRHCCGGDAACGRRASESLDAFVNIALSNGTTATATTSSCAQDPHWMRMTDRINPKFIPYMNFVGRFETVAVDARRLLQQIGAWDDFGATGWGVDGNETMFESNSATHATHATGNLTDYFGSTRTETIVQEFYAKDFVSDLLRQNEVARL